MLATNNAPTLLQPMPTRSLAISPDLDALLEHEERVRGPAIQIPSPQPSQALMSPDSPGNYINGLSTTIGRGLPPPPRGNRRPKSPRSPRPLTGGYDGSERIISPACAILSWVDGYDQGQQQPGEIVQQPEKQQTEGLPSSRTNPYINPAPTLNELGHEKETEGRPSLRRTASQQQSHSHSRAVSLLLDKRFNSCRTVADLFSDSLPRAIPSHKNPAHTGHRRPTKFNKPRNMTAAEAMENVVLDIRRASNDIIDIRRNDSRRRRPLNSHVSSRRSSSDSGSTVRAEGVDLDSASFIDFVSPSADEFPLPPADDMLLSSSHIHSPLISRSSKSPKTMFSIPNSFKSSQAKSPSCGNSPHQNPNDRRETSPSQPLPPTTNFLDMGERADLVRKSRKLTRVFGETPGGGDVLSQKDSLSRQKRSKQHPSPTALALDIAHSHSSAGRRHSIPLTPDELSQPFNNVLFQSIAYTKAKLSNRAPEHSEHLVDAHNDKLGSRVSFIDLSDEEDIGDEALSPITFAPNSVAIGSHCLPSPSQLSIYELMTPEQRVEEERRRKREKLAKLHSFLGSWVPADLVLGVGHLESSLPPIQTTMSAEDGFPSRNEWLRRRRSSSAGDLPAWSDDLDRMKEDLDDKEKAINVRRAQKMEKVFGVLPPQTLYHTRHSPSPSVPPEIYFKRTKSPPKPSFGGFIPPGEVPSPTYQQRNPNRSAYIKRPKKADRPDTAESSTKLLPEGADCYNYNESPILSQSRDLSSFVYNHYQHSLKSLGDILDRDDRESLAELHQYLHDFDETNPSSPSLSPLRETPMTKDRRLSNASSIKSERRRSLPARTSMLSIASEYSITTPKPELSDFQVRRRRAAKLTQFFGVNYRDLINDVLESLETGLEHERKRGTLRAEELEDLLERLRKIKTNRKGFF